MSNAIIVARNSSLMFTGQFVSRAAGLATFMILTRYVSVEGVGAFAYAISLVGFLIMAVDFGFDLVVTRETAKSESSRHPALAVRLKTLMFFIAYPALLGITTLLTPSREVRWLVAILGAAVWHESLNRTVSAHFLGRGRAEYGLLSDIGSSVLRLAGVFILLRAGFGVISVAVAYAAATAVTTALLISAAYRRHVRPLAAPEWSEARWLFSEAATFAAYSLFFQLYFRMDVVILGALRPAGDVAQYAAAFRVIEAALVFPAVVTGALYPVLSRLSAVGDAAAFQRACSEGTRIVAAGGVAIAVGVGFASHVAMRVIAGRGYEAAGSYLVYLVPAFALISMNCIATLALNATGNQRSSLKATATGAVTKILWNLALIPRFGVVAACVGCVVTELVVTSYVVYSVRDWFAPRSWFAAWIGIAVAAAGTLGVGWLTLGSPAAVRIPLLVVTFGLCAVAARAVRVQDWVTLRRFLGSRSGPAAEVT